MNGFVWNNINMYWVRQWHTVLGLEFTSEDWDEEEETTLHDYAGPDGLHLEIDVNLDQCQVSLRDDRDPHSWVRLASGGWESTPDEAVSSLERRLKRLIRVIRVFVEYE